MNKYCMVFCTFLIFNYLNGMDRKELIWDSKKYKANSSLQYEAACYVLSLLELKKNDKVIDFGCGNGKITRNIAQRVPEGSVLGIDLSKNMIDLANVDHADQKNLRFEQADIVSFKSDEKFTRAVAFCSLSWVKDQQQAYNNIAKILQPSARFVALVSNAESAIMRAYYKPAIYPRWITYFEDYTPSYYPLKKDDVITYMKNAGFDSVKVETLIVPSLIMSRDNLLKAMAATPGLRDVIPQEYYMDYLSAVVNEYLKEVPQDEDGNIQLDLGLFIVIGEKNT